MVCVSHGPKDALARRKGGIGFATLQLLEGSSRLAARLVTRGIGRMKVKLKA